MTELISTFSMLLFLAAFFSSAWDVYTYEQRQDAWEKAHPGSTYIRNYRKLMKQTDKARRMGGEV